jgi:hypothetical protein
MLFWAIQTIIFSILFIILAHHLLIYFKTTLTVPKIKDLVNGPVKKYEDIYNVIHSSELTKHQNEKIEQVKLEKPDLETMKTELKNYLKSKSNVVEIEGSTNISYLNNNEISNLTPY